VWVVECQIGGGKGGKGATRALEVGRQLMEYPLVSATRRVEEPRLTGLGCRLRPQPILHAHFPDGHLHPRVRGDRRSVLGQSGKFDTGHVYASQRASLVPTLVTCVIFFFLVFLPNTHTQTPLLGTQPIRSVYTSNPSGSVQFLTSYPPTHLHRNGHSPRTRASVARWRR
jgi:hypothetical protein